MKSSLPLSSALKRATIARAALRPYCSRVEIAGSVRRKLPRVGEIEIVCKPRHIVDLFGASVPLHIPGDVLGRHVTRGERYRQIILPDGIILDLFIVLPPAQWGVILALRTGSAAFSRRLVSHPPFGVLPGEYMVRDGAVRLVGTGEIVPTPEEEDFFRLCGIEFIPPE